MAGNKLKECFFACNSQVKPFNGFRAATFLILLDEILWGPQAPDPGKIVQDGSKIHMPLPEDLDHPVILVILPEKVPTSLWNLFTRKTKVSSKKYTELYNG